MNTITKSLIHSSSGRLWVAGLLAATLLAGRVQAQYVTTAVSNHLSEPYGLAVSDGNVYISDIVSNRIAVFTPPSQTVSTLAGGIRGTNNGAGTAARFNQPLGLVAARGGLVVVDSGNQELRYITLAGVVSNLAGTPGVAGYVDGPAASAQFLNPAGVAAANDGVTLYIADLGNNAIRMLSAGNVVSTIATNYQYNSSTYYFHSPAAVAVDNNSNIWVADSYNNVICMISNGVATGIAGTYHTVGTNDTSAFGGALFDSPSGLFWDARNNYLVIADMRNNTIRSLYATNGGYAVQTLAGLPGVYGYVDGALSVAEFNQPYGICLDAIDSGYYIADEGNNAVRVLQPTVPPPPPVPVPDPVIGFITYPLVSGVPGAQFNPLTSQISVFNNTVNLAIEQLDGTVETFMSYGVTGTTLPTPTTSVSAYTAVDNGQTYVQPLSFNYQPDLTVEAVSEAPGRPSSSTVSAQLQFVTANPAIIGQNSESVVLTDTTVAAQIYYTLDGTSPVAGATNTFGPVFSGTAVSFAITTNTTLSAQAFLSDFAPSAVETAVFSPTNFAADEISFGFESGEASSQFITAPGQTFIAPVTLTLIPTAESMYSLQFNLAITNIGAAPPVPVTGANAFAFSSMLEKPIPGSNPVAYEPIPPEMFAGGGFTNLLFTNDSENLIGVGWLERYGATNLYDTLTQTLITYSQAHDTLFLNTGNKVIAGAFSFHVPTNALLGQTYEIQIGSPSATSDGVSTPVMILAVTNGSMTNGLINSIKTVTVGAAQYLVGDVAPFYWFNAGDFGNSYLENNDVLETFQTAVYHLNGPDAATQSSDYFDAMDSSDGSDNNYYLGNDTAINNIKFGDGKLQVDDVYVTYRRSLDPSLTWYNRYNSANGKQAVATSNLLNVPFSNVATPMASGTVVVPASGPRYITVAADQVQYTGNLSVQVPIRVLSADTLPITVMMLRVEVDALDGSPAITNGITFTSATNLGDATMTASQGANDYAAAWLNSEGPGVSSNGILGTLSITLPPNVTTNSSYRIHFDHFSASPNGIADFHATVRDGLITVGDRSGSSWNDGIPDSWRLTYFGTVSNALSAANADPDGDGASNWAEYIAGTDPNNTASVFQFSPGPSASAPGFALQWQSVVNKHYSVQSCSDFSSGIWKTVATNIAGTGQIMQWTDTNASGGSQYYRATVQ